MVSSIPSPGHKLVCPRLLRVLQTKLRMRSLISSQTCLTLSQRGCSPMATQPLGLKICETSQMATRVWGAVSHLSIGLIPNVPIGICNKGVRLSSNGLSSLGRSCDKDSLGISDPQEPLRTCELQCHLSSKLMPFQ